MEKELKPCSGCKMNHMFSDERFCASCYSALHTKLTIQSKTIEQLNHDLEKALRKIAKLEGEISELRQPPFLF